MCALLGVCVCLLNIRSIMMTVSPSLSSRYRHRLSPSLLGSLPPFPPQTRTMKQLVPFSLAGNIFILAGIGVLVFFTMEHAIEDGVAADMPIVRRGWERGRESEERQREAERVERDQSERARRHMHVQL